MMFWLSAVVLAAAMLFGGGSRSGFFGDFVVQFLAIGLLLLCFWQWLEQSPERSREASSTQKPLIIGAALFFCMLVVQLTPLPPSFTSAWLEAHGLSLAAGGTPETDVWRTLSLTPEASWGTLPSLIAPVALFAAVSQLGAAARFRIVAIVIAVSALGLLLGFMQIAQGPHSGLRFFHFTNPTEAVGFFANRNHFAAQLYIALVFAAVWFSFVAQDFVRRGAFDSRAILWFAAAGALLIATIAGLALARSRAGLILTAVAIAGIAAVFFMEERGAGDGRSSRSRSVRRLTFVVLGLAVLFAAQFGLHRVMTRFEEDTLSDLRVALTPTTLQTALESLPFGTGLGSFVRVYGIKEKSEDLFTGYANRAHNDWAELLLETGVFGVAIGVLFFWWLARRATAIWRRRRTARPDHHLTLQRAASIVIGLLLAHSLVDYPLRTSALLSVFALACALLIDPPASTDAPEPKPKRSSRRRRSRSAPPPEAAAETSGDPDLEWPDAWRGAKT
jgi:O-antigen ligase